jgi:hypothetical protein
MTATTSLVGAGDTQRTSRRGLVLIGLFVLLTVAVFAVLGGTARTSATLDPANPDRSGAQALRRVLERQGVTVQVVRSAAALEQTTIDADTTVLVTSTDQLGRSTAERLLAQTRGSGGLVLTEPRFGIDRSLGLPQGVPTPVLDVVGDCDDPLFDGLRVEVLQGTSYPTPQGCFPTQAGFLLAQPQRGTTVLGLAGILTNGAITDADNAAVALRLLGQHGRLVWYVPSLDDVGAGEGVGLREILPRWITPALWLVGLSALALTLWRGRRLGPLVTEPLPVVVTAIETTLSRGRLYRRSGDRGHAAHTLRLAACRRLATRLALPPSSSPDEIAQLLSAQLGRPLVDLRQLLDPFGPAPTNDRDLIELGTRLDELDREVRRP